MTDNTAQELPSSLASAIRSYGNTEYSIAQGKLPHQQGLDRMDDLEAAILSYGNQREEEGIRRCAEVILKRRDTCIKNPNSSEYRFLTTLHEQILALLTPEPPTPLESAIEKLKQLRPLIAESSGGENCFYGSPFTKDEVEAVIQQVEGKHVPAQPVPGVEANYAHADLPQQTLTTYNLAEIQLVELRDRIKEILDMERPDLADMYDSVYGTEAVQSPSLRASDSFLRCALIRKELETP